MTIRDKLDAVELVRGRELVDMLKNYFGFDRDIQLTDKLGVTQNHIGGWVNRNVTPEELLIKLCLIDNLPPRAIFLGEGELAPQELLTITTHVIKNYKVTEKTSITLEPKYFNNVNNECVAYVIDEATHIVDPKIDEPIRNGRYLLSVNDDIELYQLTRLANRKILATKDSISTELHLDEIRLIGKVVNSIIN